MVHTAVTAPAFTVLDLPAGERDLIGLARVSTDAQDAQLQQDALTDAGCGAASTPRKSAPARPLQSARACPPRSTTCGPATRCACGSSTGSAAPSRRC